MKRNFRFFWVSLLSLLLCLNPLAQAQTVEQVEARPELQDDLNYDTYLVRSYILAEYQKLNTATEFVEKFAQDRPSVEKEKILKILAASPKLPVMEPIEFGFQISLESQVLKVDMRGIKKNRLVVNGVAFTIDPTAPWTSQAEILQEKLERKGKGRYGSLFQMIIPEAKAIGPLVMAALTTVVTSAAGVAVTKLVPVALDAIGKGICLAVNQFRKSHPSKDPYICKKGAPVAKASVAKKKTSGKTQSADKSVSAKVNAKGEAAKTKAAVAPVEDREILELANEKCPDGEAPTYDADLKISDKTHERKAKVRAKYAGGHLREVNLYEEVPNQKGGKDVRVFATYHLDKDSKVEEIMIPKSELGAQVEKNDQVPSVIRIKGDEEIKDESLKSLKEYHEEVLRYVGKKASACRFPSSQTSKPGVKGQAGTGAH